MHVRTQTPKRLSPRRNKMNRISNGMVAPDDVTRYG